MLGIRIRLESRWIFRYVSNASSPAARALRTTAASSSVPAMSIAIPAGGPARRSHSSCSSGSTAPGILSGALSAFLLRLLVALGQARADRVVLVVVRLDDPGEPLARGQDQVEARRHQADQGLDAVAGAPLLRRERRHFSRPAGGRSSRAARPSR